MVVPVLITSCQVLLKSKNDPVAAHTPMINSAIKNALADPAITDILAAVFLNISFIIFEVYSTYTQPRNLQGWSEEHQKACSLKEMNL